MTWRDARWPGRMSSTNRLASPGRARLTYLTLLYDTVSMEPQRRLTLAELADACATALDALGVAAPNGQVRDRPDARTIRYYTALGLVDRPAGMTGRTAWYGDRHLLQVLAVKAMQARGASLADVQRILVGASADELRSAIGPGLPAALAAAAGPAPEPDRAFWRTPPAAARPASAGPATSLAGAALAARRGPGRLASARPARARPGPAQPPSAPLGSARAESAAQPESVPPTGLAAWPAADAVAQSPPGPPRRLVAVPLAAGVTLLIEDADAGVSDTGPSETGARDTGAFDTDALRAAAAPLLAHLTAAGLRPGPPT
jgi:DNA-binding transcriptional MerR regulator